MALRTLAAPALLLTLAACAAADPGDSDSIETTLSQFDCKGCRVVAESIAFLGHPDDTVAIAQENLPAVDSRGRFYVAAGEGGAVLVFGPNGRLMQNFGKAGRGPGEFARVSEIFVGKADTLFVLGSGTVHVMSPSYEHVREFRATSGGGGFQGTPLSDGRILLPSSENAFSIVDPAGTSLPEVRLQNVDTTRCGECGERTFREAVDGGGIWSASQNSYVLERHSLTGELLQRITRDADWFPKYRDEGPASHVESADNVVARFARPHLWGVRQGSDGIVYTHSMLLENPETFPTGLDMESPKGMAELLNRLVTRIEAIDPAERKVLGEIKLPNAVLPLTGDFSGQLIVDPSGDWAWKIVRFRVER